MICPLPLSLESRGDGVVAFRFFQMTHLPQRFAANHKIPHDHGHLDGNLPVAVFLLPAGLNCFLVEVFPFFTVLLSPGKGAPKFVFVVDSLCNSAVNLSHIHRLAAHPEVVFKEIVIDHGAGDAHRNAADGEIALALHGGYRQACPHEPQNLFGHIWRNGLIIRVLHISAVDCEYWHPLLGVSRFRSCQVYGPRPLSAVKSPDCLGHKGIHIKGLIAVSPAGSDGNGEANSLPLKQFGAFRCFRHPADGGFGNHALNGQAVGVPDTIRNQSGHILGHVHGLVLKRFPNAAPSAVNNGANTHFRESAVQPLTRWIQLEF